MVNVIRGNPYGVGCDSSSAAQIKNNKIYDNTIIGVRTGPGSTVAIKNNWIYGNPTGIQLGGQPGGPGNNTVIRNNTIVDNTSYGIRNGYGPTSPRISNCIIWNNSDELSPPYTARYSCIDPRVDPNDAIGEGNITSDPCFVDAATDDYHLSAWSNCIDAGDPCQTYTGEVDIDGEARVRGSEVDRGGDER